MKRWMALPIGLAVAMWAGWALLSGPEPPGTVTGAANSEPHADIDEASRARLEAILREADGRDDGEGAR